MIKWTEYANADSFSASLGGQNQLVGYTEKIISQITCGVVTPISVNSHCKLFLH